MLEKFKYERKSNAITYPQGIKLPLTSWHAVKINQSFYKIYAYTKDV